MDDEIRAAFARLRHEADEAITDLVEALGTEGTELVQDAMVHLESIIGEVHRLIGPRDGLETEPLS